MVISMYIPIFTMPKITIKKYCYLSLFEYKVRTTDNLTVILSIFHSGFMQELCKHDFNLSAF